MVTQIDKQELPVIALPMHPARQPRGLSRIAEAQRAAGMGAISVHQNGSGAGGESAATTHGSPAFVKKPAPLRRVADQMRASGLPGAPGWTPIVRPSTARCARAEDEELLSMPSTMYLILSSAEAKPRRVSKDAGCYCRKWMRSSRVGREVNPSRLSASPRPSRHARAASESSCRAATCADCL